MVRSKGGGVVVVVRSKGGGGVVVRSKGGGGEWSEVREEGEVIRN